MSNKYTMRISRLTIDKLGVKLYDKVSAVMAELVSNCYDADAKSVKIYAPMGEYLSTKTGGDKKYTIIVEDDGIGMTPDEINEFYLRVGLERRTDGKRGDTSRIFQRKVMGRKGVGKLAPFGICQRVEIISAGGEIAERRTTDGKIERGYMTAHLTLDRLKILDPSDIDYNPDPGPLDDSLSPQTGTKIILSGFAYRRVPDITTFEKQLAQRFGIVSQNWRVELIDSLKNEGDDGWKAQVGRYVVPVLEGTRISFQQHWTPERTPYYLVVGPDGREMDGMSAGFPVDSRNYPIIGWVGYAKEPYKDDLMAGVRIYCRGKIAAQTNLFNMKAGFTGEHSIRSYFVGEIHADWLDEEEDLIQTDRRDILWSHEIGQAFEVWGQDLVRIVGRMSREPMKMKVWMVFEETSQIGARVAEAFPLPEQESIRKNALELGKVIGQTVREDEVRDQEFVGRLVQLSLTLAPHITLTEKLREVAEGHDSPLAVVTDILRTARIAELASFGRIVDDRLAVMKKVEALKDDPSTLESAFQQLVTQAPWLVNPEWSPITSNQSFTTLRNEFEKWFERVVGKKLNLQNFADPNKRVDFVMSTQENMLQMIEIKKPHHALTNDEMERIDDYISRMKGFLDDPANSDFTKFVGGYSFTLVCDQLNLSGIHLSVYCARKKEGQLQHINWASFLLRTRQRHEDFLAEAERQRRDAAANSH